MEDAVLLAAGLFLPAVVSWLKNQDWNSNVKFLFSVVVAFAATAGIMAIQGNFDSFEDFMKNASVVWAETQLVYQMYFGGTRLNDTLEKVRILRGKPKDLH